MPRRKPLPPSRGSSASNEPLGIRELDRFSEASIKKWSGISRDVDELHDVLYFGLEPERRRLGPEIHAALQSAKPKAIQLDRWVRIVTYQYSLAPLSSAGSLHQYGGRFNIGIDVDEGNLRPWPTLYLAENFETSFRERFGLSSDERVDGLRPEELALEHGASHTAVFLRGSLNRLFDIREEACFVALATVLRRIKMPERATRLRKKLQIPPRGLFMAHTPRQMYDMVAKYNWRMWPAQFGLPAPSHILADLVRQAGFEGIIYRSSKGPGDCIALFTDRLTSGSYVELIDSPPPGTHHSRLDDQTAAFLAGWESVPANMRPR